MYLINMDNIQIREATVNDALGIAKVHVETWQSAYRGQVSDAYLESLSVETKVEGWRNSLEHPKSGVHTLVAILDDQVVGWCVGGTNRDEDVSENVGELQGIYVHPDFAGKGAGSALMNEMLKILRNDGYQKATLWVLDTNEKTRKWYESKGWEIEGGTKVDHRFDFDLNEVRYIVSL